MFFIVCPIYNAQMTSGVWSTNGDIVIATLSKGGLGFFLSSIHADVALCLIHNGATTRNGSCFFSRKRYNASIVSAHCHVTVAPTSAMVLLSMPGALANAIHKGG